jgi:hypothetical protein
MRRADDYSGEMDGLSSNETQVVDRLRDALLKAPAPEVAAAHLTSMAAAVDRTAAAGVGERRDRMRAFTRRRRVALAAAAALALGAGLAAAVTLPDQASDRAEEAQAAKPAKTNGDGPSVQSSDHGDAVSALAQNDSLQGCEHGRAVSDLASSKADDNRNNDGPDHDPCEKDGNGGANRATGKAWGHGDPPGRRIGQAKQAEAKVKPAQAGGVGHGRGGSKSDAAATDTAGTTAGTTGTTGGGTTAPSPEPTQDSTSMPTPESSPTA